MIIGRFPEPEYVDAVIFGDAARLIGLTAAIEVYSNSFAAVVMDMGLNKSHEMTSRRQSRFNIRRKARLRIDDGLVYQHCPHQRFAWH